MPQSAKPGIGGGLNSCRRWEISSASSGDPVSTCSVFGNASGIDAGLKARRLSEPPMISSDTWARGWPLCCAGRRMITWDFGSRRAVLLAGSIFNTAHICYTVRTIWQWVWYTLQRRILSHEERQPTKRETIARGCDEESLTLFKYIPTLVFEDEATFSSESLCESSPYA